MNLRSSWTLRGYNWTIQLKPACKVTCSNFSRYSVIFFITPRVFLLRFKSNFQNDHRLLVEILQPSDHCDMYVIISLVYSKCHWIKNYGGSNLNLRVWNTASKRNKLLLVFSWLLKMDDPMEKSELNIRLQGKILNEIKKQKVDEGGGISNPFPGPYCLMSIYPIHTNHICILHN